MIFVYTRHWICCICRKTQLSTFEPACEGDVQMHRGMHRGVWQIDGIININKFNWMSSNKNYSKLQWCALDWLQSDGHESKHSGKTDWMFVHKLEKKLVHWHDTLSSFILCCSIACSAAMRSIDPNWSSDDLIQIDRYSGKWIILVHWNWQKMTKKKLNLMLGSRKFVQGRSIWIGIFSD